MTGPPATIRASAAPVTPPLWIGDKPTLITPAKVIVKAATVPASLLTIIRASAVFAIRHSKAGLKLILIIPAAAVVVRCVTLLPNTPGIIKESVLSATLAQPDGVPTFLITPNRKIASFATLVHQTIFWASAVCVTRRANLFSLFLLTDTPMI